MPGFGINWLKRILHEDDRNDGLDHLKHYYGLEHNSEILKYVKTEVIVSNPENIPLTGGIIFASNHPLGWLDGMALVKAVGDKRPDVRFFVNDILKGLRNYGDIFVGVNKLGNTSRQSLEIIANVYASEAAILVFPAGLVSRELKEGIQDLEWNKSFISKAIKYNKPIIPVYIEGRNSSFFYNLSKWRKRLFIKANIEMIFLPDEMFKQQCKTIHVHIGNKIDPSFFDKSHSEKDWAEKVRGYIYSNDFKAGNALKV